MVFDPCPHQKTQIVLKAGAVIRSLKGLPEEKNITTLYDWTANILGIQVVRMDSNEVNHLPSPSEMKDEKGNFIVPRKNCPNCGGKDTVILVSICPTCKDSDGGKYKSGWTCETCHFIVGRFEKFFSEILIELGVAIPNGSKQALGIKTLTDEGLK